MTHRPQSRRGDYRARADHSFLKAVQGVAQTVTSLTALAALIFTGLSLQQARNQNSIAEQGKITDRYRAAIDQLGSQ